MGFWPNTLLLKSSLSKQVFLRLKKKTKVSRSINRISENWFFLLQFQIAVIVKTATSTTVTDKIKDRLEELDQFEEEANMQEMINLSQQEYAKRIEELNNELLQAWNEDERVKSLKIVIQVSSVLFAA
jgi:hypothetical protein